MGSHQDHEFFEACADSPVTKDGSEELRPYRLLALENRALREQLSFLVHELP